MKNLMQLIKVDEAERRILLSLSVLSLFAVVLLILRVVNSGTFTYIFLAGNLILAWIPLALVRFLQKQKLKGWQQMIIGMIWLLCLPNAPYLITDLIHLNHTSGLFYFDLMLIFCFAFTGLLLGTYALLLMFAFLRDRIFFQAKPAYILIAASILLSSIGVFMGRELRLNSWDALINPLYTLLLTLENIAHGSILLYLFYYTGLMATSFVFFHLLNLPQHESNQ
jgi:uncharacterized membrane protein